MFRRLFNYLKPIWSGRDEKPSIRRLLSLYFSLIFTIEVLKENTQSEVLWVIAALIAGLLSLTTFQNVSVLKGNNNNIDKVED